MRLLKAVVTISFYTMLSRVLGLIREGLMSHMLGSSLIADAFVVAFKLPNFFRRFFAEGAFNAAFVPLFASQLATRNFEETRRTGEQIFAVLGITLLLLVMIVEAGLPWIIHIIAPGFGATPERLALAIAFSRITFPYILFISLSSLLAGILNSLDRFAAAAAVPLVLNILMIAALLLHLPLGMPPGFALSWAVSLAGLLQCAWMYWRCESAGMHLRLCMPRFTPAVRQVIRLMIPGAIGSGVMQINLFVDMILASLLSQGSLSYLYYADRLNELPLAIFGIAIGTALLPLLSRQIRTKQQDQALKTQAMAVELALQLTLPAAVGLMVLAYPIIDVIYHHGQFSSLDVSATAPALIAYVIGLPAYVLSKIFSTTFFAHQDTTTPVKCAIACVIVNFLANLILMQFFSHVGLALATSLAAWLNCGLLLYSLSHRGWFIWSKDLSKTSLKIGIACGLMAFAVVFLKERAVFFLSFSNDLMSRISSLIFLILSGIGIFIMIGQLIGALNLSNIKSALRQNPDKREG